MATERGSGKVSSERARDRLIRAAFDLFSQQGFERTTVDEIAARAGAGRTTFFRHFPTKEAVVFPDHDAILAGVEARLAAAGPGTAVIALHEASRVVLRHYLDEGELARERYALTRTVRALRDAEIAGQRRYQRLFRRHLEDWQRTRGDDDALLAEVIANVVVTTHNHVLRAWLRGESNAPEAALETAIVGYASRLWQPDAGPAETQVVVLRTGRDLTQLLPDLTNLLSD